MTRHFSALIYASFIGLIIVAIFLGFLSSMANPISWILIIALFLIPFIYNKTNKDQEIRWSEDYCVGVESLDREHKKIFLLLNNFKTAYDYAMSEEFERQALDELLEYTKFHFTQEEKLMAECHYPELAEHQKEHQQMIKEIEKIEQRYHAKGHEAFEEVCDFLTDWLVWHIKGSDRRYTDHISKHQAQHGGQ